jgi:MFS family permease
MPQPARERIWQTTQWGVWMLALSVFLNYVDRGALSVAMPRMQGELQISSEQLGLLASAFFWTYALLQVPAGWLCERFNVKHVLTIGFALWTFATGLTAFANTFALLLFFRLILGIGESVAYPAYSQIISTRFPPEQRGFPNALIDAFSKFGPALSTLLGGLTVATFGWRALFLILGIGGALWLLPWLLWDSEAKFDGNAKPAAVPFGRILGRVECWGTIFGLFAINYSWYFLIFWYPSFLVKQRGFSEQQMALVGQLPFWAMGAASFVAGVLSDRLIVRGRSATFVRKGFISGGLIGMAIFLLFATVPNTVTAVVSVIIGAAFLGLSTSNNWAVTQTIAGPGGASRWTGIQNGFGNFGGVVSPWLTGRIVDQTGSFYGAFAGAAGVAIAGALLYYFLVRKVEPIKWDALQRAEATVRLAD